MLEAIKLETGSKLNVDLIKWVITVPAIWSEESKQFMREAVYKAGCIKERYSLRLVIALEPEAASLCCRRLNIAHYVDSAGVAFPTETKYLVLDCGGGTVDITAHEIQSDKNVKELYKASGGPWGGTRVDDNFVELLKNVFGAHFLNTFKSKHPQEWQQFLMNFEKVKKSFKPDGKSKLSVYITLTMGALWAEMNNGKSIKEVIKASSGKGVAFSNGAIVIKHEKAKELFTPVVDQIVAHTRELLQHPKLKKMQYILMVGGFSDCPVLQEEIRNQFQQNRCKVLVPSEAQLAIIKGAVLFGHNPAEIATRIAKYSYGMETQQDFNQQIHDEQYKTTIAGRQACDHLFYCIVHQDQEVKVGSTFRKVFTINAVSEAKIYRFDGRPSKPIQYTKASGMECIGMLKVPLGPAIGSNYIVKMRFGDTELQVEGVAEKLRKTSSTVVNILPN